MALLTTVSFGARFSLQGEIVEAMREGRRDGGREGRRGGQRNIERD